MRRTSLTTLFVFATLVASSARAEDPQIGKTPRYCNPLPMVTTPGGNAAGDVTVIREQGKYYMYCTGGGAWISDDLLNWSFHRVANVPVAPHVVKYNGSFYMCGNSGPLFKADSPLGPFTSTGEWKSPPDVAGGWRGPFDMDIYIDDDNRPYLYFPGRGIDGIYVVPLDPNDLTRFAGPVRHLFAFNRDHVWERYGEMNEYTDVRGSRAPGFRNTTARTIWNTQPPGRSGSPTPRDTTPRSHRWARSPMLPTTH
jgi:hypothetical protein